MEEEENFLVPRKEHGWAGIQSGCSQQVSKELEAHLAWNHGCRTWALSKLMWESLCTSVNRLSISDKTCTPNDGYNNYVSSFFVW